MTAETKFAWYRNREKDIAAFFSTQNGICYCNDISGLLNHLNQPIECQKWFLFMDASAQSFKAILIEKASLYVVPLGYTTVTRETYTLIREVLILISYSDFCWEVCADFKIIGILMGLQGGYVRHGCFLCQWNSRDINQFAVTSWPLRTSYVVGYQNVQHEALISLDKICLPLLHVKLGIFKNFLKALDKESQSVKHLHDLFPK